MENAVKEDVRKEVSYDEMEKRVQIESAHLTYFENISRLEADKQAREFVESRFKLSKKVVNRKA